MDCFSMRTLCVFNVFLFLSGSLAVNGPLAVPFNSSTTIGPDGPWNFITLSVGSEPARDVSFFPMSMYPASILVDGDNCRDQPELCDNKAQFYSNSSHSAQNNPQHLITFTEDTDTFWGPVGNLQAVSELKGNGTYWLETLNAPINYDNIAVYVTKNLTSTVGKKQYKPISLLSLEEDEYLHKLNTSLGKGGPANATTLMEETSQRGGSGTFGLHMGAAAFGQKGSLYMGGYDSKRLLGPVMQVPDVVGFQLTSIAFGVSSGKLPLDTNATISKPGLPGNFADRSRNVTIRPNAPYMYLPFSWCSKMAEYLPISYDSDTNLYLWNTLDQTFHDLMSSPSYMEFTFGDSAPLSIRVPFAALNLTLEAPLKDKPTSYFPCYPRDAADPTLGRAFLQTAFYGQAWTPTYGSYILAQAPGPSVGKENDSKPVALDRNNPIFAPALSRDSWEDTWAGVLKPMDKGLTDPKHSANPVASPVAPKMSDGAIAGLVIGLLALCILIGVAAYFYLSHRQRQRLRRLEQEREILKQQWYGKQLGMSVSSTSSPLSTPYWNGQTPVNELEDRSAFTELSGTPRAEAPPGYFPTAEMDSSAVFELSADARTAPASPRVSPRLQPTRLQSIYNPAKRANAGVRQSTGKEEGTGRDKGHFTDDKDVPPLVPAKDKR